MLSLCIISRKEDEKALIKAVVSCVPYVDEIVIIDTSKEGAISTKAYSWHKYGEHLGDFEHKLKVIPFAWTNDFSAARNFSFEQATGDVILWIDSDDTVIHPEKLPELAKLITDGKCDAIELEYLYERDEWGNIVMRHWKPRLFKKGIGEWKKTVHENFEYFGNVKRVRDNDVKIDHHTDPTTHREKSAERNLKILLEEYNKYQEKTDPRTLYYIGNTLMGMEKFEEAIPFYTMHAKVCGWPEEKYFSLHYLSHCYAWTGDYDMAINLALEATKIFPGWSLAYFDLGEYYSFKKDYEKVMEWITTGLEKEKPNPIDYFINDTDYTILPLGRLADAYLEMHLFDLAYPIAAKLYQQYPKDKRVKELFDICKQIQRDEKFVESFVEVAGRIKDRDRIKAVKLFDLVPSGLDEDIRIQEARKAIVPPRVWESNSVVFYCHGGLEDWAYPSIFTTGIGGSETMVIQMAEQLTKAGYKVTIYNRCGDMRGTYQGVEYIPYYMFNTKDTFNTLVVWRFPGFLDQELKAKKKYLWLHDIVSQNLFNDRIIESVDKILFLSKWHRDNVPNIPESKVYLTNNGINPKLFENVDESKRRKHSLVYTSSYDRGLVTLGRDILPLIEKEIPDVTLDICYGTANLEKEMHVLPHLKEIYDECQKIFTKPNVTHHGRIPHEKVAELLKTSRVFAYSSEFGETNNISAQQAQAAGCYVITTSQAGATPERVRFGKVIKGNGIYTDKKLQQKYADEVIKFLKSPTPITEEKRKDIITEFDVATTANQWIKDLL